MGRLIAEALRLFDLVAACIQLGALTFTHWEPSSRTVTGAIFCTLVWVLAERSDNKSWH